MQSAGEKLNLTHYKDSNRVITEKRIENLSFRRDFLLCDMDYVILRVYDNYIPAHIAMGRLEEDGINCWLKDENTVTIDPILTNAVGGIKLMVPTVQAERAAAILKEIELRHKATITCTNCGSHNVELVSTPRKPSNWIGALIGFFITDYGMPFEKVNHCFNCGKEFAPKTDNEVT